MITTRILANFNPLQILLIGIIGLAPLNASAGRGGYTPPPPPPIPSVEANAVAFSYANYSGPIPLGETVNLDGLESTYENIPGCGEEYGGGEGVCTTFYQWRFVTIPEGDTTNSNAVFAYQQDGTATFVPQVVGEYVIELNFLVESEELDAWQASDKDQVTVTVIPINEAPIAEAGPNQSGYVGEPITLDATGSSDDNYSTEQLCYQWTVFKENQFVTNFYDYFTGNSVVIFTPSETGEYEVTLRVIEPDSRPDYPEPCNSAMMGLASTTDSLIVSIEEPNAPPVADAGEDQASYVGASVMLDGNASSDPDGDALSYAWQMTEKPAGSTATLVDTDTGMPSFVPDMPGTYIAELHVDDGIVSSESDTTEITVITAGDYAEMLLMNAMNSVKEMPLETFGKKGNQKSLLKNLAKTIKDMQKVKPEKALKRLGKAAERIDGCALRGNPDSKETAKKEKKDYISNCSDQNSVYQLVTEVMSIVNPNP